MTSSPQTPSLPSSVNSDGGPGCGDSDSEVVSLPDSVKTDDCGDHSDGGLASDVCCKQKCASFFSPEDIEAYKLQLNTGSPKEVQDRKFDRVRAVFKENDAHSQQTGIIWKFQGQQVCRKFWIHVHGLSPGRTSNLLKHLRAGNITRPEPAPRLPKPEPALDRVNVWLLDCYQHLADPLALPGSEDVPVKIMDNLEETHEILDDVAHPLYALSFNVGTAGDKRRMAGRRHVNFTTIFDLFKFYQADVPAAQQASRSTFERAFRAWSKYIILKSPNSGNKCTICLRLQEARTNAASAEDKAQIDAELTEHLNTVKLDRKVNTRGNHAASQIKNFLSDGRHHGIAKIMVDGMDQQKFCLPRAKRLCGTSEYGKCWKPNVHVTGAILFGVCDFFFLLPMDNAKDSSMQCSVLSRVLDVGRTKLQEIDRNMDLDLPENLVVAVDNTPRESKNQVFAVYLAQLAAKYFRSVECQYLQTQHTHNELDQRFSSLATLIKNTGEIQTMQQLKEIMEANMKPLHGRSLHVEIMDNTWNFKEWFQAGIDSNISGLTSTKTQGANHLWRFERRECLQKLSEIECHHEEWQSWAPQNGDVCMTVKQFISDKERSQMPELICPAKVWLELKESDLQPCHTNPFSERTLQEFRHTAEVVGRAPWNLLEGQHWLEELCTANEQRRVPDPVKLDFIFSLHGEELRFQEFQGQDLEIAEVEVPKPRTVRVAKAKPKRGLKRPAAAEAALRRPASALRRSDSAAAAAETIAEASDPPDRETGGAVVPADPHAGSGPVARSAASHDVVNGPASRQVNQDDDDHVRPDDAVPGAEGVAVSGIEAESEIPSRRCKMQRPAAAGAVLKRPSSNSSVSGPAPRPSEPATVEDIKNLPNFLYFGCGKCRTKQTPKTGCKECREKADRKHGGFRRHPDGWIYRLNIEDVD